MLFPGMFLIAGFAFFAAWIIGPWVFHDFGYIATCVGPFLTMSWVPLLAVTLVRFKKKGLWLLIDPPFALYRTLVFPTSGIACGQDVRNCP